ncbi:hypothetical protein GGI24_002164 [Coemansia furcata]|nr:hypothetical protein GGI24_002164 [Coemansia furcata]
MSFAFTPEEQSRVDVAKFFRIHLDPIGYVDLSTIIVLSTMYFVERSPLLRNCKFTLIWLKACIGAYYVTSLFALRYFSLYYVFYKGKAFKGHVVYLSFGITVLSIILFGVVSTLLPTQPTTHYEEIVDMCYANHNYIVSVIVVIWSIWTFIATMTWRMRNVPFCFNERIEIMATFMLLLAMSVLTTTFFVAFAVYPASLAWRTGLMYTNHVSPSIGYWIIMGEATYNCMFHREEYLEYWVNTLKEDDMERQYEYSADLDNDISLTLVEYPEPSRSMFADTCERQSLDVTKVDGLDSPQTQNSAYLVNDFGHK